MTTTTVAPSHNRLLTRFAAIGPYLRNKKSSEDKYFFDSLSVCVDAKKSPEEREFWGWWLELTSHENGFQYVYQFGRYDESGEWVSEAIPAKHQEEVVSTLNSFYTKLTALLTNDFSLSVTAHPDLQETILE